MKKKQKDYTLLFPGLSFALLAVVMLVRWSNWITLFGLMPFIVFCMRSKNYAPKTIMRSIYWPSVVYGMVTYAWVLQISPSSWTTLQGSMVIFSKIAVWALAAFSVSIGFWLLAKFVVRYRSNPQFLLFSLPVVWAICELIRVYTLSTLVYGPGASLSPNWNLGLLGLGLVTTPLGYASRFLGLYGMSIATIVINIALYKGFYERRAKTASLLVLPIVLLSALGYMLYQPNGQPTKVAAVHLETRDNLEKGWPKIAMPPSDTELLVLPEYSLFFQNKDYQNFANKNFSPTTTIITSVEGTEKPASNLLTAYQPNIGIYNQQPKTFLVAGGEYMPYIFSGFFSIIKQSYLTQVFNDSQQVRRGARPEQPIQADGLKVGSLVCSGILTMNEYRSLTNNGAQVLTNSASLSLIANASLYHEQESYLTRFHAIANARPFVQASRSGESYIIDSNGHHIVDAQGPTKAINATTQSSNKKTVYSLIGEWTLLAGPFLLLLVRKRFILLSAPKSKHQLLTSQLRR